MTTEIWAAIPGFRGHEVSTHGRVRSWVAPRRQLPLMRKVSQDRDGYPRVIMLGDDGRRRNVRIHTLVASAFLGRRPAAMQVRHLDGNAGNPALHNLAYGTGSLNQLDKREHGTDHNVIKTHCPRQHPYDSTNTYVYANGKHLRRGCRACNRLAQARRKARSRAVGEAS